MPVTINGDGTITGASFGVGYDQTWQDLSASRTINTSYQNTTGRPIQIHLYGPVGTNDTDVQISSNNSTWINVGRLGGRG